MERIRHVRNEARYGGAPCAPTTQSESCNNEACDQDCGLGHWTKWSSCSKACDGGFLTRHRHVTSAPRGSGSCPADDADSRLEYKRCNEHACVLHDSKVFCEAKLDVIILLDGSSNLGQEGWESAKAATAKLVGFFDKAEATAQVAVLLYSGPESWGNYKKCMTPGATAGEAPLDMVQTCKMIWVRHFTTDGDATLAADINNLAWPRATQATSMALTMAETELLTGRAGAQQVVIVITDGTPLFNGKTQFAAESIQKRARLIWVPISAHAHIDNIKKWASKPVADNVLVVNHPSELSKTETLNKLVADACPKIKE